MLAEEVRLAPAAATRLATIQEMVGHTPMLLIDYRYRGRGGTVAAKAEHLNFSGSIKDRMALHILRTAYVRGALHAGDCIAEATSGNTGIAFAALGAAMGHPVRIYMPDWMSRERKDLVRSYGAELIEVTRAEGGFLGSIERCGTFASQQGSVFLPRQFENESNPQAHEHGTAPEMAEQMARADVAPAAVVAGVGTGGTIMGLSRGLRRVWPGLRCHPVEPAESPTLTTGHKVGSHRIQGISDEFIPQIVRLSEVDEVIAVHDGDSILMAQSLARSLGLAVGISSGCNFLAAVKVAEKLAPEGGMMPLVTTVFSDDSRKYLSTGLTCEEPVHETYLSPEIELLDLRVVRASVWNA